MAVDSAGTKPRKVLPRSWWAPGIPAVGGISALLAAALLAGPGSVTARPQPPPGAPPPAPTNGPAPSGHPVPIFTGAPTNQAPGTTAADAEAALKRILSLKQTGPHTFQIGQVDLDRKNRTVSLPARVNLRSQVVEYALVTQSGKAYESLLTTEVKPTEVHLACLLLGMEPVHVGGGQNEAIPVPSSNAVTIAVNWETNGSSARCSLAELVSLTEGHPDEMSRAFPLEAWLYNGSAFDPMGFLAQREGSIISLIRDAAALVNNPRADRDNHHIHWPNAKRLPPEGYPVRVILQLPSSNTSPAPPASTGLPPPAPDAPVP